MTRVADRPAALSAPAPAPPQPARSAGFLASGWAKGGGLVLALVVLAVAAFCSVAYGSRSIGLGTVWDAFTAYDDSSNDHLVVRTLRVPRTLLGLSVGAALGASGALIQGMTRNPLADPGLLGLQAGAALAVVAGLYVFGIGSLHGYVWFAFVGAGLAGLVVYTLGSMGHGGATPVKLALVGAALSAMLASFTQAVILLDADTLDRYRFWIVGSLAGRDASVVAGAAPFMAAGGLLALVSARHLNALALGDEMARSLGQRVQLSRGIVSLAIVLLCGAATAAAGPIMFVGLTVPHVARSICGPDYRWILPWSAVLGPSLLLSADVIGRVVARPGELQVGIVTALIGAPVFITLIRRKRLTGL